MKDNILPLGSIVLLKNAQKKVMIIGYLGTSNQFDKKSFDYKACLYPEGMLDNNQILLFNNDAISQIYYIGCKDDEWNHLKEKF